MLAEDDEIPPRYDSDEIKRSIAISSTSFKSDPMSTSFYGAFPQEEFTSSITKSVPIPIAKSSMTTTFGECTSSSEFKNIDSHNKKLAKYLDEADLDFEKTFQQQSAMAKIVTSKTNQSTSIDTSKMTETSQITSNSSTAKTLTSVKKDDEQLWDKPLGIHFIVSFSTITLNKFIYFLELPSPAPENDNVRTTPKRERKSLANKNKLNLQKRSQSPLANKKLGAPIYMDLAYVPHHGNSYYSHVEFFKKIRARYYVFSGIEPSKEVYNALLEGKQSWEDKNLGNLN